MTLPLAEYGVAIFAIGTSFLIVRAYIKSNREKDDKFISFMEKKDTSFTGVINNHLSEEKALKEQLIASNNSLAKSHERLEKVMDKVVDKL